MRIANTIVHLRKTFDETVPSILRTRANCSRWFGKMMNRLIAGIAMDLPRFSNDINRPCFWRYDRFGNCKRRPHCS